MSKEIISSQERDKPRFMSAPWWKRVALIGAGVAVGAAILIAVV